ncbi:MAG: phage late control D family protein [Nitrospinae bacterium]|nr:phage late control D family protein [Nitrospinota bacterium]
MSRPFLFHLNLLSENPSIPFKAIVGQNVTLTVVLADNGVRYFNGIIGRFSQGHSEARFIYYQAEIVPWLWFLTQTADCRIFQNLTVPE